MSKSRSKVASRGTPFKKGVSTYYKDLIVWEGFGTSLYLFIKRSAEPPDAGGSRLVTRLSLVVSYIV
jgi:hypothetical protein